MTPEKKTRRSVEFTLEMLPVAWARPRLSRSGHFITAPKMRAFQSAVKEELKAIMFGRHPLEGPLLLAVTFYMVPPKKRVRESPFTKPDLSNLVKNIEDSMNGIVYHDDAQIVQLFALKVYDWNDHPRGRIQVEVREIQDNLGNKK